MKRLIQFLFGDPEKLALEQRLANAVWFFSAITGYLSLGYNCVMGLHWVINFSCVIFAIVHTLFFFTGRKHTSYERLVLPTIASFFIFITFG